MAVWRISARCWHLAISPQPEQPDASWPLRMLRLPQARQTYYRWETLISSVAGLLHWESGPKVGAMAPSIHKSFVTMRTEPETVGLERRKEQRSCNDNAPFSLVSLPPWELVQ